MQLYPTGELPESSFDAGGPRAEPPRRRGHANKYAAVSDFTEFHHTELCVSASLRAALSDWRTSSKLH